MCRYVVRMVIILGYLVWVNIISKYKLGMNRKLEDVFDIYEISGYYEEDLMLWFVYVVLGELCIFESLLVI